LVYIKKRPLQFNGLVFCKGLFIIAANAPGWMVAVIILFRDRAVNEDGPLKAVNCTLVQSAQTLNLKCMRSASFTT